MMIQENPDTIMEIVEDFITAKRENEEVKFALDDNIYKAKIEVENSSLNMGLEIFRYGDKDMFVIEFIRKAGSVNDFYKLVDELKKEINVRFGY